MSFSCQFVQFVSPSVCATAVTLNLPIPNLSAQKKTKATLSACNAQAEGSEESLLSSFPSVQIGLGLSPQMTQMFADARPPKGFICAHLRHLWMKKTPFFQAPITRMQARITQGAFGVIRIRESV
jgi:hypothetical protein